MDVNGRWSLCLGTLRGHVRIRTNLQEYRAGDYILTLYGEWFTCYDQSLIPSYPIITVLKLFHRKLMSPDMTGINVGPALAPPLSAAMPTYVGTDRSRSPLRHMKHCPATSQTTIVDHGSTHLHAGNDLGRHEWEEVVGGRVCGQGK